MKRVGPPRSMSRAFIQAAALPKRPNALICHSILVWELMYLQSLAI